MTMRVITGRAGGMRLECPPGDLVRPVPDMARQAVFSILGDRVQEAVALDLFAGAGTMGIEALSRGAARCVFVEKSHRVIRVLRQNLDHTRLDAFGEVLQRDVFRCLSELVTRADRFDLVFLCPPFPFYKDAARTNDLVRVLGDLPQKRLLNPGAWIILQQERRGGVPDILPRLALRDQRDYGRNVFNFWELGDADA